jgi:hypothetical protein
MLDLEELVVNLLRELQAEQLQLNVGQQLYFTL